MPLDLEQLYQAAAEHTPTAEIITFGEITLYLRQPTTKRFDQYSRESKASDTEDAAERALGALVCELIEDAEGNRVFASLEDMKPLPQVVLLRIFKRFFELINVDADVVDAEGN